MTKPSCQRWHITLSGRVQGVGFRPAVVRAARVLGLVGQVGNEPGGVVIEVEGPEEAVERFIAWLEGGGDNGLAPWPDGANVAALRRESRPLGGEATFSVAPPDSGPDSGSGPQFSLMPDRVLCAECRAEVADTSARRHRYPFTSCAVCGPRWSIASGLPWTRSHTSMATFPLCPACAAEFADIEDRRFHAEALACPECGPRLTWRDGDGRALAEDEAAMAAAVASLRRGGIVALKGLGGFQLVADATDTVAVARLRQGKGRPEKPLAVMVADGAAAARLVVMGPGERALFDDPAGPIVLARRQVGDGLAWGVAPGLARLGVMAPSSALHGLLLGDVGRPLVVTSGNRSGEPLCTDGETAVATLGPLVDGLLDHDRAIVRPLDDSVVQWVDDGPQVLRLGRGLAPLVLNAEGGARSNNRATVWLGLGGQLKAAPALAVSGQWLLGAHVGDLEGASTSIRLWREAQALVATLGRRPAAVAHDAHPDYASSQLARDSGLPLRAVDHHHAHALAALAGCGWLSPSMPPASANAVAVTVLAWDGTGLGEDGSLRGSEVMVSGVAESRRLARLRPFALPGAEAAIREPRRAALGLLHAHAGGDPSALAADPLRSAFDEREWPLLLTALERQVNSPATTGMGRLFDAVAALLGLAQGRCHEGRAALLLQEAAEAAPERGAGDGYPFALVPGTAGGAAIIDWGPALTALLADRAAGVAPAVQAARFHWGLARLTSTLAGLGDGHTVLLTGGCFQNRLLLELSATALRAAGYVPDWPRQLPPGDGGLALGQIVAAALNSDDGPAATPRGRMSHVPGSTRTDRIHCGG